MSLAPPDEPLHGELVDAFAKLGRAYTHLKVLDAEVSAYTGVNGNACAVYTELYGDEEPIRDGYTMDAQNGMDFRGRLFAEINRPPTLVALVLGDFLTNCRAVLDHLAWQVREPRRVTQGISPGRRRVSEFPKNLTRSTRPPRNGFRTRGRCSTICTLNRERTSGGRA